jgi:Putative lumazine-binding
MNLRTTLLFLLALPCASISAQTDREKVEATIRTYVEAFYEGDTLKMQKSLARDIAKFGYAIPKGKTDYEKFPNTFEEMHDALLHYGKFPNPLPPIVEVFDVLDKTASGKVSAGWGIDYVLLDKQKNGHWLITHVLWQTYPPKK